MQLHLESTPLGTFTNLVRPQDNFETARGKAKIAEDTSDLNSEAYEISYVRPARRTRKKIISSSDEDSDTTIIPSPPKMITTKKKSNRPTYSEPVRAMRATQPNPVQLTPVQTNQPSNRPAPGIPSPAPRREYIKELLRQVRYLKNAVEDLVNTFSKKQPESETMLESIFSKFTLPINNERDLEELNSFLQNEESFREAVKKLSMTGGNSLYEFVRRCMGRLFTNNLAHNFSWLGRRKKKPFHDLRVANLIMKAIIKAKNVDTKEAERALAMCVEQETECRVKLLECVFYNFCFEIVIYRVDQPTSSIFESPCISQNI
ncbi:unnamed protein product [Phaedon cochleariae]|uniref:DUF4806 domain-containing protein n=1 Tax=Phaedon cochleariae TaxID=80249 RepID=A0A9N9X4Y5_PHACE|nr:unnamed protein product [Phaedon cochleariae]